MPLVSEWVSDVVVAFSSVVGSGLLFCRRPDLRCISGAGGGTGRLGSQGEEWEDPGAGRGVSGWV